MVDREHRAERLKLAMDIIRLQMVQGGTTKPKEKEVFDVARAYLLAYRNNTGRLRATRDKLLSSR